MATKEDVVQRHVQSLLNLEIEAISDGTWGVLLSRLDPSLQVELSKAVYSDGETTYVPSAVLSLLCCLLGATILRLN